jgi:uncharacterized protein YbaP (TraB family)
MGRFSTIVFLAVFAALGAQALAAPVVVHPAYWTIHGKKGSLFILSSIHALPKDISWANADIDAAAARADTYVFEAANDKKAEDDATKFMFERGFLPPGETLQTKLSPIARKDYIAACALAGTEPKTLDNKRMWVAAVLLTVNYMNKRGLTSASTPDEFYIDAALRNEQPVRYLDTTWEQMLFLARYDETMGIDGFSTMLGDFTKQPEREDALIAAWSLGDTVKLASLIDDAFKPDPDGARLFARHNREWAMQLEDLLESDRNYFVVVGVAHLVGPQGVPSLLRADGYTVDGP